MPNNPLLRVLLITLIILLVPLILQLTVGTGVDGQGFNWKIGDFVLMGALIFITVFLVDIAWRKAGNQRLAYVAIIILGFLWLYVELAVGLFTNWGS